IFVVAFIIGTGVAFVPILFGYGVENLVSQALSQVITFGGTAFLFSYMFFGNPVENLKLVKPSKASMTFLATAAVLLLVLPASDWLATVNDGWHFPQSLEALERALRELGETSQQLLEKFLLRNDVGSLIANLLVLAVVPALCEELFFRGALQQTLVRCFKGRHHIAIWLTAAIFSLLHGDLFAFLPRFMLGVLLGYLYYYGRSLWVNAAAHFLNNAFVVVLYFLAAKSVIDVDKAETLGLPFVVVLITFVASIALFYVAFVRGRKKTEE
ncbi:MAG: CPBP family intramembrane metalloprotease, partial [Bacteroidales bacterium]|nr:CPBP family intramembrane metalloprotease [Bacteroidales bacterium]